MRDNGTDCRHAYPRRRDRIRFSLRHEPPRSIHGRSSTSRSLIEQTGRLRGNNLLAHLCRSLLETLAIRPSIKGDYHFTFAPASSPNRPPQVPSIGRPMHLMPPFRSPLKMSMYSLCQLAHDVPEPRAADRTLGNQLSIVDNAEHAIGRRKLS